MNAAAAEQLRLLELQRLDSAIDRLAHRRETLPETAELADLEARLREAADAAVTLEAEDRDLAREQRKVEDDVELVSSRMQRDRARLDTGQVSSPRELENLQSEVDSLARRQSNLEDQVLEVMERREQVGARLEEQRGAAARLTGERDDVAQRRETVLGDLAAEEAARVEARRELAATLPGDLLALYEQVRKAAGGVGAAMLRQGRCEGCHLQLNTVELNDLRAAPADLVIRCEECRRILVRTPESGL